MERLRSLVPVIVIGCLALSIAGLVGLAVVPTIAGGATGWSSAVGSAPPPMPGKIEFGKPKWNRHTHRYQPLTGWKCGKHDAVYPSGSVVGWIGRLHFSSVGKLSHTGYRILRLKVNRPIHLVLNRVIRLTRIDRVVRGTLSPKRLRKLGMGKGVFRLEYFSGNTILAEGEFRVRPRVTFITGY